MGTWGASIKCNDTFQDVYSSFLRRYNSGEPPTNIAEAILKEYRWLFEDKEDRNNAYFAVALAQWETGVQDDRILKIVKDIINSGDDLRLWELLGADKVTLNERSRVLKAFLAKLNKKRAKPIRRSRSKNDFRTIQLIELSSPDQMKTFTVSEEYVNERYVQTGGLLMWKTGGGSVLYYRQPNQNITAEWTDSSTLEIRHDKGIEFFMRRTSLFHCGDEVTIKYVAI